jgi:uroporphyrinogen-III synthase
VRSHHLRVELQPAKANAGELAQLMMEREAMDSAKVLVVTGNLNRDTLVDKLNDVRAIVDRLPLYQTEPADLSTEPAAVDFRAKGADAILFASPSAVQSFADQGDALKLAAKAKRPLLGSIGPTTSTEMRQLGLPIDFEAAEPSLDALVSALLKKL